MEFRLLPNKNNNPPKITIKSRGDSVHIVSLNAAMTKLLNVKDVRKFNMYVSLDNSVVKIEPSETGDRKFLLKECDCTFAICGKDFNPVNGRTPVVYHIQDGSLLIEWPNTKGA